MNRKHPKEKRKRKRIGKVLRQTHHKAINNLFGFIY
jgi:hypothetical protein